MPKWYVDRSRYEDSFSCPWRRLLKYHAAGTGWIPPVLEPELATGLNIHAMLEQILNKAKEKGSPLTPVEITGSYLPGIREEEALALARAWARANLGWLMQNYEILSAEEEISVDLGDDIIWMARPDAVVRSRETGLPCVVEFKSTRAKAERMAQLYANSLQSVMNAYAVSSKYNQPCGEVQIHMLQVGTEQWPTPLTHAYYRPAQPPYVTEDWQPKSRRPDGTWLGKLYRKVAVADHRPLSAWVQEMPASVLTELVPISVLPLDPRVQGLKIMQAIASIRKTENEWRTLITNTDWTTDTYCDLANRVPRSFNCHSYNRLCEYTSTCFDPDNHSLTFQTRPIDLIPRTPHHPQEGQ